MSEENSQQTLVEQFELADSSYDAELDSPPEPTPVSKEPSEAPAAAPTLRDANGRFLPTPKHPDRLIRQAKELGLPDEEIATLDTVALKEEVLYARLEALQRSAESGRQQNTAAVERTAHPAGDTPVSPEARPTAEDDLGIDEAGFDPDLVKVLKRLSRENQELKKHVSTFQQAEGRRVMESAVETADRIFAEDEATFGKGTAKNPKFNDAERLRRHTVFELAKKQKGTDEECVRKAVEILYGTKAPVTPTAPAKSTPTTTPDDEENEVRTWNRGVVARPTQRSGSEEPKGPGRAVKAIAKKMRENGQSLEDYAGPEEAGLPD